MKPAFTDVANIISKTLERARDNAKGADEVAFINQIEAGFDLVAGGASISQLNLQALANKLGNVPESSIQLERVKDFLQRLIRQPDGSTTFPIPVAGF